MKTIPTVVTAIALTLTGCAHTGYYQQSSYGYDTGGYTTVDSYYGSPGGYYYQQPGGVYSYEYYSTPSYGSPHRRNFDHDHDRNQDRDRHDRWRNGGHGYDNRRGSNLNGNDGRDNRDRWNWNSRQSQDYDRAVDHADRQRRDGRGGSAIDNVANWRRDDNRQDDNSPRHSRRFGEAASNIRSGDSDLSSPNRRSPFGGEGRRQHSRD